jgi:hypothetical protein
MYRIPSPRSSRKLELLSCTDRGGGDVEEERRDDACHGEQHAGCRRGDERHRGLQGCEDAVDPHQPALRCQLRDHRDDRRACTPAPTDLRGDGEQDDPQLGDSGQHGERQRQGDGRDGGVGDHHQDAAVHPIRQHATEERDDALGSERGEHVQRHRGAGLRLEGDVPHHHVLHDHRPEERAGLPAQEERDVALPVRQGLRRPDRLPREIRASFDDGCLDHDGRPPAAGSG